ncbi:ATP-binding protein [Mesorhizobium caraganae]|nr:ATP-binding protein [Mesorhizobium caraganae]
MKPAIVEKATTPFFSTAGGNHTGLGLTACSHMVSTLNGKLFISSIPGAGTVVHVKVPLSSPPLQQANSRRRQQRPDSRGGGASRPPGLTGRGIGAVAGWGEL